MSRRRKIHAPAPGTINVATVAIVCGGGGHHPGARLFDLLDGRHIGQGELIPWQGTSPETAWPARFPSTHSAAARTRRCVWRACRRRSTQYAEGRPDQGRPERARRAAIGRHHPHDPVAADESLRRLRTLRAAQYIRELVSTPPVPDLTERQRLARILSGVER